MLKKRYLILAKCFDKSGKLLSTGTNSYTKTHPLQKYFACLTKQPYKDKLHAEVCALLRAKGKKIHKITVERYSKDGSPLLAAPCPICTEAILAFGVKEVEFTVEGSYDRQRFTVERT